MSPRAPQILKLGTRHAGPVPRGGKGAFQMGGGPGTSRSSPRASPGRDGNDTPVLITTYNLPPQPDPAAAAAAAAARRYSTGGEGGAPPSETDRIMWIVETAYDLGLAEVLGLEGPPQYPRSRRISPVKYRRQYYDALYGSPERLYGPADAAAAAAAPGHRGMSPVTPIMGVARPPRAASPLSPPQAAAGHPPQPQYQGAAGAPAVAAAGAANPYGYAYPSPPPPHHPPPPGYYSHVQVPPDWQGPTGYAVEVAAARRRVHEAYPDPPAQWYPRSRRISP